MAAAWPERIDVVDSHTEGEPTRVVVAGWPQPAGATMAERRDVPAARAGPPAPGRGVRAARPRRASSARCSRRRSSRARRPGVVFFNNAGALGMCGHGLIGRRAHARAPRTAGARRGCASTRRWARWAPSCEPDGAVTIENVPALLPRAGRRARRARPRARHGRRRLGRQLVLPDRARRAGRSSSRTWRALTRGDLAHPARRCAAQGITGATGRPSTTSSSSGPPRRPDADCATSSSARASPTTARPAAPARRPRWPCLARPGQARAGRALAAGEHHRAASSRAGWRSAAASSSRACAAAPSSPAGRRSYFDAKRPVPRGLHGRGP